MTGVRVSLYVVCLSGLYIDAYGSRLACRGYTDRLAIRYSLDLHRRYGKVRDAIVSFVLSGR
jgi:hypothetical protein